MNPIWLLMAKYDAPGWKLLEKQAKAEKIDWLLFDRSAWVLLRSPKAPTEYEGFQVTEPKDGIYVDQQGRYIYLVNVQEVPTAQHVIDALGEDAAKLLEKLGDPDVVLQRLGRAF